MAYYVRNDTVINGLGYAIPNVAVTYYLQPGMTLANVYDGPSGAQISNPQYTNGLGQTTAYLASGTYTITYSGEQIQTESFADQDVGGSGGGSTVTLFSGALQGTQDGVNKVFTLTDNGTPLTSAPSQAEVWNNFPLVPGTGYTLSGVSVIFTNAPQTTDTLWAQGATIS